MMNEDTLSLADAFGLKEAGHLVAIVGGGGKSSLMFALAESLPGRVVITTTTRIFAAQIKKAPAVLFSDKNREIAHWPELGHALDKHGRCLVIGQIRGDKAGGLPVTFPGQLLKRPDVDYVVAEADGSRMRPCKAPADHEPAIPPESTLVVPMAGLDSLDGSIGQVAHRPERVAELTGLPVDAHLTPETLARLLVHPAGGLKNVPSGARVVPMLNKVESQPGRAAARQTARFILRSERVDHLVLGALGAARPIFELQNRVTAVVLAAGESKRMGQTKQLLPWGETTVLGQTLTNLAGSLVHDVLVVTGHERQAVSAVAAAHGTRTVFNPRYASGEMLSSLQEAIRHLGPDRSAVLVVLADQPLLQTATIDQLLTAYWQGRGRLVAPLYARRRGNPVVIDRTMFAELLDLPQGEAPRRLIQRHPEALYLQPVDDPAVIRDLDHPDDYRRWLPQNQNPD